MHDSFPVSQAISLCGVVRTEFVTPGCLAVPLPDWPQSILCLCLLFECFYCGQGPSSQHASHTCAVSVPIVIQKLGLPQDGSLKRPIKINIYPQ